MKNSIFFFGLVLMVALLCGYHYVEQLMQKGSNLHDWFFLSINIFTVWMCGFNVGRYSQ